MGFIFEIECNTIKSIIFAVSLAKKKIDMKNSIVVDNLKCGGCANTITKKLSILNGISNVTVDKDTSTVTYEYTDEIMIEMVEKALAKMGYPKEGTSSLGQKAKSFVSCATGKMDL